MKLDGEIISSWREKIQMRQLPFKIYRKRQLEKVHEGKIFKFDTCPSNFIQKYNLKKHIKSVHETSKFNK